MYYIICVFRVDTACPACAHVKWCRQTGGFLQYGLGVIKRRCRVQPLLAARHLESGGPFVFLCLRPMPGSKAGGNKAPVRTKK